DSRRLDDTPATRPSLAALAAFSPASSYHSFGGKGNAFRATSGLGQTGRPGASRRRKGSAMRDRIGWVAALAAPLLVARVVPGAEGESGFHPERRVREATRLDWEFAAGPGAKLPGRYDSRRQRYQLFAPATYKPTKAWPLVVFVSPGDDPLGWRA